MWAPGAALLHRPEPAQFVQPATVPRAQEAQQHRGQAMGSSPQQAAQTKGLQLTYAHTLTQVMAVFLLFLLFVLYCLLHPSLMLGVFLSVCAHSLCLGVFLLMQTWLLFLSDCSTGCNRAIDVVLNKKVDKMWPAVTQASAKIVLLGKLCFTEYFCIQWVFIWVANFTLCQL